MNGCAISALQPHQMLLRLHRTWVQLRCQLPQMRLPRTAGHLHSAARHYRYARHGDDADDACAWACLRHHRFRRQKEIIAVKIRARKDSFGRISILITHPIVKSDTKHQKDSQSEKPNKSIHPVKTRFKNR